MSDDDRPSPRLEDAGAGRADGRGPVPDGEEGSKGPDPQRLEYDQAQQEYRYRDTLAVTEFYYGLVAAGLVLNYAADTKHEVWPSVVAALIGAAILGVLALHLCHLLQDRDLMWKKACECENDLHIDVNRSIARQYARERTFSLGKIANTPLALGEGRRRLSGTTGMLLLVRVLCLMSLGIAAWRGGLVRHAKEETPCVTTLATTPPATATLESSPPASSPAQLPQASGPSALGSSVGQASSGAPVPKDSDTETASASPSVPRPVTTSKAPPKTARPKP
jgi:hypothetical protein